MPGQAIVTIRDKQWTVSIADIAWELAQGLGGLPELPAGTGMLFDTGWEQVIQVTTMPMLFPLDIAFLSESLVVTELYRNVEPGYILTSTLPARYFLEVSADELKGVEAGDRATVEFLPLEEIPVIIPDWMTLVTSFLGFVVMAVFMTVIVRDFVKHALQPLKKKPVLYGPRGERLLPQTVAHKELAARILRDLSGKGERYCAYVKYPKDKSAFVTVGAIVGGHYSWNPAGFTVWVDAWERNPEWPPDHILGIKELRRPRTFEATEEGVKKALEYVEKQFPTFTESRWVSKSIPVYVAQELGILKLGHLPQTTRKLTSIWFEKGVRAGKTDGWMDVENTIKETARDHPEIKDAHELVWTDIDLWEQTNHFNILYGSKMWEDAGGDLDVYSDLKSEFWEGYLAGRKETGKDIYKIARELVKSPSKEFLPQTVGKRGEALYRVNLAAPKHIEEVVLENGAAVLKRYGKPVVRFKPTIDQIWRLRVGKGYIHIFPDQVTRRLEPRRKEKLAGDFIVRRDRMGNIIITYTLDIGKSVFLQSEADRKLVYDILTKEEREDLDDGWRIEIRDDEPRASVLEELWEGAEPTRPELLPEAKAHRFRPGEIARYKGEKVRVREHIGDRVLILIPSRQEEVWVKADSLEKMEPELLLEARYRGLAVMPRLPDEARKDILFVEHIRDLVKLGERVTDEEARLMWQAWKKRYPQRQAQTIPRDDYELGYQHGMSICELYGVKQAKKLARLKPINRYERGKKQACIDYLKQRGIEVPVEARRRKSPAVVPTEPRHPRPRKEGELEFLPDSPEVLAQTIDAIGYREKIDSAFQEAIKRVKGLSDIYRGFRELQ